MKTKVKFLFTLLIAALALNVSAQQKVESHNFKVLGNCGMCEKTIEKAALKSGATKADWNKDTKILLVEYDSKKVNSDKILKSVAYAGYDNEKFLAPANSYNSLQECCKYERVKINETAK